MNNDRMIDVVSLTDEFIELVKLLQEAGVDEVLLKRLAMNNSELLIVFMGEDE